MHPSLSPHTTASPMTSIPYPGLHQNLPGGAHSTGSGKCTRTCIPSALTALKALHAPPVQPSLPRPLANTRLCFLSRHRLKDSSVASRLRPPATTLLATSVGRFPGGCACSPSGRKSKSVIWGPHGEGVLGSVSNGPAVLPSDRAILHSCRGQGELLSLPALARRCPRFLRLKGPAQGGGSAKVVAG